MIVYINQFKRTIKLLFGIPEVRSAYVIKLLGYIPGFKFKYERVSRIQERSSFKGIALGMRRTELWFRNNMLLKVTLESAQAVSAFHFYLNRPTRNFFKAIRFLENKGYLFNNHAQMKIFEPGCGTGKYLSAYIDKYGGKGIGIDVYKPAIEIAEHSAINNRVKFSCMDVTHVSEVSRLIGDRVDIVFTSSFLVHINNSRNKRRQLLELFKDKSGVVFGLEKKDDGLINDLISSGYKVYTVDNTIVFVSES